MKYSTTLGDKICEATANSSIGLRHICAQLALPYSTVTNWIYCQEHELYNKYIHAKKMQLYHIAEEILEIADNSVNDYMEVEVNGKTKRTQNKECLSRTRLRIQARLNILTKLAPILYGTQSKKKETAVAPQPEDKLTREPAGKALSKSCVTSPSPSERAGERSAGSSPKTGVKPAPVRQTTSSNNGETATKKGSAQIAQLRNQAQQRAAYAAQRI